MFTGCLHTETSERRLATVFKRHEEKPNPLLPFLAFVFRSDISLYLIRRINHHDVDARQYSQHRVANDSEIGRHWAFRWCMSNEPCKRCTPLLMRTKRCSISAMTYEELQQSQDQLLQKIWMLSLENDVYERYLTRYDPQIVKSKRYRSCTD